MLSRAGAGRHILLRSDYYKQKVDADSVRKRGWIVMLCFWVQQTERYTDLLNQQLIQTQKGRNENVVACGVTEADGGGEMMEAVLPMSLHQNDLQSVSRHKRQRSLDYAET